MFDNIFLFINTFMYFLFIFFVRKHKKMQKLRNVKKKNNIEINYYPCFLPNELNEFSPIKLPTIKI